MTNKKNNLFTVSLFFWGNSKLSTATSMVLCMVFNRYDCVTLMFSGIVGFGQYCAANTDAEGAMKIVKMLNELYTLFDALTDSKRNSNIYKVSTRQRARREKSKYCN